jgi:PilZ domain
MKRLRTGQIVTLAVGDTTLDCRVTEFVGTEVALSPVTRSARSLPASGGASIVFEHRGGLVQLRGALYHVDEGLRFAVTRTQCAGQQRRRAARIELALPVMLTPLTHDGRSSRIERHVVTFDLSLSGMGLRLNGAVYPRGDVLRFELRPPGGNPLTGKARVVHVTGEMCGLAFEEFAPADHARLAGYLVGAKRERSRRVAIRR